MQRLGPARAAATLLVALIVVGCGTPQVSPPPASASAIASAVASDAPSAATWQPGPEAPIALIEQATAVHDGRIWTAGGLTADGQAVDTVLILDPASGEWSEGPPLPIRLHHAALVSDGVDLWLLGGYLGDTFGAPTDVVRRLPGGDPEAAWEVGSPLPQLRAAGAAVWDGERIVYGGGVGPGVISDLVFALGDDGTFAPIARLSISREHLAAATDGAGQTWFLGGRQGGLDSNMARVDVVEGNVSEVVGEMPSARGGVAAFWSPSVGACMLGGEAPDRAFRDVECITAAGETSVQPPMLVPRHGFGAVVIDGTAYAVFGGPEPALTVSSTTEVWTLP
jgi:hypothetical protein